jgi:glycosyltransferase involved in cell wall biosynthesis
MANELEVSVVIPTLNRWPLLERRALPSALAQEDVEFEVVVVDDGSTDQTPARLAEVADRRLRVVRHESRRGLAAARNTGVAAARSDWVAFLDDDDLWAPRKLRRQLDAAVTQGADWGYVRAIAVDEAGRVVELDPLPSSTEVASLLLRGNFVPGGGSAVMARTDLVQRVGGFDTELRFFEDWDLWLRLAAKGPPAVCADVLVARLEHGGNMLFRDRPDIMSDLERLLGKHVEVTDRRRLGLAQWVAAEHRRAGRRWTAASLYLRAAARYRSPGNLAAAIGALFGDPGIRLARRLLALRGLPTHLDDTREIAPAPAWLESYR